MDRFVIWCITGIHCPDWIENARENFKRCQLPNARHIIVENGNGVGLWPEPLPHETVIKSEPGASQYINAGLQYVREHGSEKDWFVKFDSDDFYGKNYLTQIEDLANDGAVACGATTIFVKTESNKLLYIDAGTTPGKAMHRPHMPHGPTLAARMQVTMDFPHVKEMWGEDAHWVESMRDNGIVFHSLPLEGFAYVRHRAGTHTFPVPEELLRHVWRVDGVYDAGDWNEDIVEGRKVLGDLVEIPHDAMKMHEAFEHLLEVHIDYMKIHEVKKNLMDSLNTLLDQQRQKAVEIGQIQAQIEIAKNQVRDLSNEYSQISDQITNIGTQIAEDCAGSKAEGRVVLERGVFVEGVPGGMTHEELVRAVDEKLKKS